MNDAMSINISYLIGSNLLILVYYSIPQVRPPIEPHLFKGRRRASRQTRQKSAEYGKKHLFGTLCSKKDENEFFSFLYNYSKITGALRRVPRWARRAPLLQLAPLVPFVQRAPSLHRMV